MGWIAVNAPDFPHPFWGQSPGENSSRDANQLIYTASVFLLAVWA